MNFRTNQKVLVRTKRIAPWDLPRLKGDRAGKIVHVQPEGYGGSIYLIHNPNWDGHDGMLMGIRYRHPTTTCLLFFPEQLTTPVVKRPKTKSKPNRRGAR